jgi:LysR family transcriptional regulator, chromosome initiation inhibitor
MSLLNAPLVAFLAVVKNQTVHSAAKELGLTQTGVTQRIRLLESQLSTTLFTRSRRGMMLTHEGNALFRYCQAARDLEGQVLAHIDGAGKVSEVRVGITGPTSIIESRVTPQCLTVLKQFPQLLVTFNVVDIENRLNDLRTGAVQLAIVPRMQVTKEMDSKLLRPERYVLVACPTWKGRSLKEIVRTERIIDFDPTDRMTQSYLKSLGILDQAKAERHFVNNNSALIQMFSQGLGYGVLTEDIAAPFIRSKSIFVLHQGKQHINELALAWYPRMEMPPYFKAIIQAVK